MRGSASQSGPAAPVMRTAWIAPDREVLGHGDDAVDLGGLAVAAGDAGGVDEHVDHLAHQLVAPRRGDVVLQLAQLGEALGHRAGAGTAPSRSAA